MNLKKNLTLILHIIGILPLIIAASYFIILSKIYQQPTTTDFLLNAIYYILLSIVFALFITNTNSQFLVPRNIENKIEERFEKIQKNINLATAGIVDFAKGKARTEKYEQIAFRARKEIFVNGTTFSNFVQDLDKIKKLITKLDRYRILMLDPNIFDDPNIEPYLIKVTNKGTVKSDVETNFKKIKQFQKRLYNEKKELYDKLKFRTYNSIPTMTFYLTDPNNIESKMVVELLPNECAVNDRPMIILEPHSEDDLYHFLLPKFEKFWDESKEIMVEDA